MQVLQVLTEFSKKSVLVIGDLILDSYLEGSSTRLCREAPVPIVDVLEERTYPGGAANVAVNVAALGANCSVFSVLGKDTEGDLICKMLRGRGVETFNVLGVVGRKTLLKQRLMCDGQMLARIDKGNNISYIPSQTEEALLLSFLEEAYQGSSREPIDAVIISDYGYGAISSPVFDKIRELQSQHGHPLFVDAKDLTRYSSLNPRAMTPNYAEAMAIAGEPILPVGTDRKRQVEECGNALLDKLNAKTIVVTLDRDGAVIVEQGNRPIHVTTTPVSTPAAGGAGDTFISAFALCICAGASAELATQIGVKAATVAVSLPGTTSCSFSQLSRVLLEKHGEKFLARYELNGVVEQLRRKGAKKIVFTNGCYDLVHCGHIQHLQEAASLGDALIVGINTDESVRRLKGELRPVNSFGDRVSLLSAFSFVDFVTALPEDDPRELIKEILPDVFVKGGDYRLESLPEAALVEELGGQVRILPLHAGYSTTNLIEKVRANGLG